MSYFKLLLIVCWFGLGASSAAAPARFPARPAATPPTLLAKSASQTSELEAIPEWAWWGALTLVPAGIVGGVLYKVQHRVQHGMQPGVRRHLNLTDQNSLLPAAEAAQFPLLAMPSGEPTGISPVGSALSPSQAGEVSLGAEHDENCCQTRQPTASIPEAVPPQPSQNSAQGSQLSSVTRVAKTDRVVELVRDLHHTEASYRRKAIWELGQQGDSRAIQPLVDLLIDSDSQQRSLILAAVSEIAVRSLKPLHRALLVSLQDDSTDVRKNAIRDVARVYDGIAPLSQRLQYATSDSDSEVRETAQWALAQLNRLRGVSVEERSLFTAAVTAHPADSSLTNEPESRSDLQT
ncbi:MAG: HEAT repeat domain-containing protein [Synechococcales cyanobacterium M58_A2018_015]|nr:HEAT repeat domain-containing protein [Synechococcales cyanobacterium M58_A2018_015]